MLLTTQEILLRLFLSTLIGGIIGYDREFNHRAAGFRTHILVCIGATLISIIQIDFGNKIIEFIGESKQLANIINVDYSRLGAQVISGIGFLGAGTIIQNKGSIKGLTTAASLWVVGGIGLAIGMGEYITSILATVFIVITLVFFKKIERWFIEKNNEKNIEITYIKNDVSENHIQRIFEQYSIQVKRIEFVDIKEGIVNQEKQELITVLYTVKKTKDLEMNKILYGIYKNKEVLMIRDVE